MLNRYLSLFLLILFNFCGTEVKEIPSKMMKNTLENYKPEKFSLMSIRLTGEYENFKEIQYYVSNKNGLNLLENASENSKIIGKIKFNENVEVIQENLVYFQVKYNGKFGYVDIHGLGKRLSLISKVYSPNENLYYELLSTDEKCFCSLDVTDMHDCYVRIKDSRNLSIIKSYRLGGEMCTINGWYSDYWLSGSKVCCGTFELQKFNIYNGEGYKLYGGKDLLHMPVDCGNNSKKDALKYSVLWINKNNNYYFLEDYKAKELNIYFYYTEFPFNPPELFMNDDKKCLINPEMKFLDKVELSDKFEFIQSNNFFTFNIGTKEYIFNPRTNKIEKF
ncbi:MAG: SH3 domain-containing protein [Leptospiraceae bacterium]|nr:SH3 domain-containing protein [Leptospiraceae bacterium]